MPIRCRAHMPPRPRRVVASGALLLALGAALGIYRSPPAALPPATTAVELAQPAATAVRGNGVHSEVQQQPPPPPPPPLPPLSEPLPAPTWSPLPPPEPARKSVAVEKPMEVCERESTLHSTCRKCRSGSAGDGGVEAVGGLCREHCSRQGSGFCGTGDDYVDDGLDCRPCRRWLPGADIGPGPILTSGSGGGGGGSQQLAPPHTAAVAPAPMLLADDRIDAVCFEPASAVDSHSSLGGATCLGGDPCPTFTSLAVAQVRTNTFVWGALFKK